MKKFNFLCLLILLMSTFGLVSAQEQFIEYDNNLFQLHAQRPETWKEVSAGTFVRNAFSGDVSLIVIQSAEGDAEALWDILLFQLGLTTIPEPVGTLSTDLGDWTHYQISVEAPTTTIAINLALLEQGDRTYLVMLQTQADESETLYTQVFEPVLQSIQRLEELQAQALASSDELDISLIPFESTVFSIEGLVPETWAEAAPGVLSPPAESADFAILLQQSAPVGMQQMVELLQQQFGMSEFPEPEAYQTNFFLWDRYLFDVNVSGLGDLSIDMALTESDGRTYVAILQALSANFPAYDEVLFLPVLDAFSPLQQDQSNLPSYMDPATFTETDVTIGEGSKWPLPATLTLPNNVDNAPVVVLVHGSGPNDRDETLWGNKMFRDIAWGLATQGIATLRYDKRTLVYGDEMSEVADFTIDDETTDDAIVAVEFLKTVDGIDPEQIYVLGHSLGGMMAPRIGVNSPDTAGLILMAAPARFFEEMLIEQLAFVAELPENQGDSAKAQLEGLQEIADGLTAIRNGTDAETVFPESAVYWQSIADVDQLADALAYTKPMLILQGLRDYQVTTVDAFLWEESIGDLERVTYIAYPQLQHTFMAIGDMSRLSLPSDYSQPAFVDPEVIQDIATWIKQN
ncbi:hypothetical protein MASR2M15_19910 [Anaerolineales bacterium]